MARLRNQHGATLVLIIGVVAALAILAAAMVALTANVQHNTATHRTQSKAFNVAEAGLDAGQAALWVNWPEHEDEVAGTLPTVDPITFQQQFDADEFPSPTTGQFIAVEFKDDDGDTVNPGIAKGQNRAAYDKNQNDHIWIISRGATGSRAAKVQALVKKVQFDMLIKEGVALFTDGKLETSGTGSQPVIGVDWPATAASVYAGGGWDPDPGNADLEAGISLNPDTTTARQDVFPDETLAYLIETASAAGKYYETQSDIPAADWSTDPRIIVVDHGGFDVGDVSPPNTDTDVSGNDSVWSEDNPGVLIVLDGDLDQTGLKKTIYGIVYLVNGLLLRGNAEIHGMCVAVDNADARGTRAINYNYEVIANLNRPRVLSVKLVANTWREIQP